jgi:hypothetical protein
MNRIESILVTLIFVVSFQSFSQHYDSNFIQTTTINYKDNQFNVIELKRDACDRKIKTKYFECIDPVNSKSTYNRYKEWSKSKNIILATNGPTIKNNGFSIFEGKVINHIFSTTGGHWHHLNLNGLLIIFNNGGMTAHYLNSPLKLGGITFNDVVNNRFEQLKFIEWCKSNKVTIKQYQLFAYDNSLIADTITQEYNTFFRDKREHQFLVIGLDKQNEIVHYIVNSNSDTTPYIGAKNVFEMLCELIEIKIHSLIYMDTAAQDIFNLFNNKGERDETFSGNGQIENAQSLIVYYYE